MEEAETEVFAGPCDACKCDRCESERAGEPATLPMEACCEGCGGRAKLGPLCLNCTGEQLDQSIATVEQSIASGSPLLGRELLRVLKSAKTSLPEGPDRVAYWRHAGWRRRR